MRLAFSRFLTSPWHQRLSGIANLATIGLFACALLLMGGQWWNRRQPGLQAGAPQGGAAGDALATAFRGYRWIVGVRLSGPDKVRGSETAIRQIEALMARAPHSALVYLFDESPIQGRLALSAAGLGNGERCLTTTSHGLFPKRQPAWGVVMVDAVGNIQLRSTGLPDRAGLAAMQRLLLGAAEPGF